MTHKCQKLNINSHTPVNMGVAFLLKGSDKFIFSRDNFM